MILKIIHYCWFGGSEEPESVQEYDKKVLFLTNELYPNLNANSEIAYRIARCLRANYDCDITIMGYNIAAEDTVPLDPDGINSINIHSLSKYYSLHLRYHTPIGRITHYIQYPDCFRYFLRRKLRDNYAECKEIIKALQKVLKHERYDCIIAFSYPWSLLEALTRVKTDIPFIAYKLDPWSNNSNIEYDQRHITDERNADNAAAAIITTDLIKNDYPYNAGCDVLQKMHVLKFPNIINYGNACNDMFFKPDQIHCLFAGKLYKSIREPKYTFKLFERLFNKKIVLHVFGYYYNENEPKEQLPENVIYHGSVSSDEVTILMQSADILVNIGNSITNMMPSKLLTYFSLGKPVLNIIKNEECPTLPYMEKYPLGLSVLETDEPTLEDVKRVEQFILNNKGRSIPFDTVKELYYDCTPEYVCEKVYEIISKVVKDKKGEIPSNGPII